MRAFAAVIIFANVTSSSVNAQPNPDEFQSKAAASAIKSYLNETERAKAEYEKIRQEAERQYLKAESKSREALIESLTSTLKREVARENLEESVRIKKAIDDLKNSDATSPRQPAVVGVWKIRWIGWPDVYQAFHVNGNSIVIERKNLLDGPIIERGFLQKDKEKPFFKYQNGARLDRYSIIDDGRMLVEQWNLSKDPKTANPPGVIGIATRVE